MTHDQAGTILVVEDNEATRAGLVKVLQQAGYSTVSAANGREALDYLRSHPPPNLVLLDMFLPILDGWEFLAETRQGSMPIASPIVITTGTIIKRDWALAHGCAGYVGKPIDAQELLQEIQRCLTVL